MPVVTRKSSTITNRDANLLSNSRVSEAVVRQCTGIVQATNLDSIGSKYVFAQLPTNAVVSMIRMSSPDIGTTIAMDLGVYRTTKDGGAVVDADLFGSNVSFSSGAFSFTVLINESGVYTLADMEKPLWQAAGLSADPGGYFDLVATLTAAADADGSIQAQVQYTI